MIVRGSKVERDLLSGDPKCELITRYATPLSAMIEPTPDAVADRYKTIWQLKRGRGMAATLSPAPQEQGI